MNLPCACLHYQSTPCIMHHVLNLFILFAIIPIFPIPSTDAMYVLLPCPILKLYNVSFTLRFGLLGCLLRNIWGLYYAMCSNLLLFKTSDYILVCICICMNIPYSTKLILLQWYVILGHLSSLPCLRLSYLSWIVLCKNYSLCQGPANVGYEVRYGSLRLIALVCP